MTRPRLLDLFSGAGGCSVGYHRAGFDVTGVDIDPHPDYPYKFRLGNAMDVLADRAYLHQFDVVHASPPCHAYSTITPAPEKHPRLIGPVRDLLRAWGGPYVIENVAGARKDMENPVRVCGSAFGLSVRRHRWFESNLPLWAAECQHHDTPIGVYGDHPEDSTHTRPDGTSRGVRARTLTEAQEAMGIDWMGWDDLTDAIPPAYTQYLGEQLLTLVTT